MKIIELPAQLERGLLNKAIDVATAAHEGVSRRPVTSNPLTLPYITHPKAVAAAVVSPHLKILAWLHDVMEDNPSYTEARMRELFPAWVVDHLLLLTKLPGEPYDEFILRAVSNPATRAIKIADIRDNLIDLKPGSLRDKYRLALRLMGEDPDKTSDENWMDNALDQALKISGSKSASFYETLDRAYRLKARGPCEKCGVKTNWIVNVNGRAAYWCGCGD